MVKLRLYLLYLLCLLLGSLPTHAAEIPGPPPALAPAQADRVLVEKAQRRLTLYRAGVPIRSYRVALGRQPLGPKQRAGDGRTPEGLYLVDGHKADSAFHQALHLSYPNAQDRARAAALGVPPGGDIMIHGLRNGLGWIGPLHRLSDWTRGCIALTDPEIDEVARLVPDGTVVEIRP
ncbi:MAG: L,D-transpeptidase family protein [Nevskia sp.]|nr:L,D-transpeptidase family protein [Nevskia sp.]